MQKKRINCAMTRNRACLHELSKAWMSIGQGSKEALVQSRRNVYARHPWGKTAQILDLWGRKRQVFREHMWCTSFWASPSLL
jgi:hypothetical protein